MKEPTFGQVSEQIKKWCDTAMVMIVPGKDGFTPSAQPTLMAWIICPMPFRTFFDVPGVEIPQASFAIFENECNDHVVEILHNRFQEAVLSLWELVTDGMRRKEFAKRMR